MKTLMSMTDFVLETVKEDFNNGEYPQFNFRDRIYNYAKFLKQPLELWMFVPSNEYGNVLEEPNPNKFTMDNVSSFSIFREQLSYYRQAKERCLFDGFEYNSKTKQLKKGRLFLFFSTNFCEVYIDGDTECLEFIEDIVKYNLQLTPTAIKQLGL